MALMKVRILRGVTIADKPVFDREKGGDPPTFANGDVIEVERALAQELVGSQRAEYVSGEALNEISPSDKYAAKAAKETKAEEKAAEQAEEEEEKAAAAKQAADEKKIDAAKAKRTRKKAKAAKAKEEEKDEEEPSAVTTAAFEPPEENAMYSRPLGRFRD